MRLPWRRRPRIIATYLLDPALCGSLEEATGYVDRWREQQRALYGHGRVSFDEPEMIGRRVLFTARLS